jgi:hypothetical protein
MADMAVFACCLVMAFSVLVALWNCLLLSGPGAANRPAPLN